MTNIERQPTSGMRMDQIVASRPDTTIIAMKDSHLPREAAAARIRQRGIADDDFRAETEPHRKRAATSHSMVGAQAAANERCDAEQQQVDLVGKRRPWQSPEILRPARRSSCR